MPTEVHADEHIGILHHVIRSSTMNIPYHMRDEALSEGLVLLVQASKSYDEKHNVPVHFWLAKKIRWGLLNWKLREAHRVPAHEFIPDEPDTLSWQDSHRAGDVDNNQPQYDPIELHQARMELERIVKLASKVLSDKEYIAVIGPAFGLHMKELSHMLGANPNQIKAMQERGRTRINEMRLL